ncbi:MAG: outer membrane protein transport protein [Cyclobacteriaceae bacterium]|nr:outer membrane protein transport protein [Cyclobacteriaceae bacterium]
MKHIYHIRSWGGALVLVMFLQQTLMAAGYQVLLQGNRATAMGNLGVGLRPDASSMFFNPGAMPFMEGNQVMLGINLISSNIAFWDSQTLNSNETSVTDNPIGTPFHAYAVWGPAESKWKFALGAYTPFGSKISWGQEWQGRYLLDEISLTAIYTQATASYQLLDNLSIGAGIVAMFGSVELQRVLPVTSDLDPTIINLQGDAKTGFGYNVGLYWVISEKWQMGASYRSRINAELEEGDVTFENVPASLELLFQPNKFSATLPLPSQFSLGFNFEPSEQLTLGIEANYIGWSAYESLDFNFEDENIAIQDTESPRNYHDSYVFHFGGEYRLNEFLFRAGTYYDLSPVDKGFMTPETPDTNRIGITAGLGYSLGEKLQLDLSFLYIRGQQRTQTIEEAQAVGTYPSATNSTYAVEPGTYKLRAYIPGLSITYKF